MADHQCRVRQEGGGAIEPPSQDGSALPSLKVCKRPSSASEETAAQAETAQQVSEPIHAENRASIAEGPSESNEQLQLAQVNLNGTTPSMQRIRHRLENRHQLEKEKKATQTRRSAGVKVKDPRQRKMLQRLANMPRGNPFEKALSFLAGLLIRLEYLLTRKMEAFHIGLKKPRAAKVTLPKTNSTTEESDPASGGSTDPAREKRRIRHFLWRKSFRLSGKTS